MARKPSIVVMGDGPKRISMIAIDLDSEARAIEVAKKLAEQTGRVVTVRDARGDVLDTIQAPFRN